MRTALAAVVAFGISGAHAGDPLQSQQCRAARAVLEDASIQAQDKHPASRAALDKARKDAARECLGRQGDDAVRVGAPDPVIGVARPVIDVPRSVRAPEQPARVPPLEIARPSFVTACDPGGCWDNSGQRLNSVGPVLLGPRGIACTVTGGVVQCP